MRLIAESYTIGKMNEHPLEMEETQGLRGEFAKYIAEEYIQSDFVYVMFKTCKTEQCIFRMHPYMVRLLRCCLTL